MRSLPLVLLLSSFGLLLTIVTGEEEDHETVSGHLLIGEGPLLSVPGQRTASPPFNTLPTPKEKISREERQARKLLRKKKKRLRELRDEIRKLGGVRAVKFSQSRDEKWRRRMLARLDTIAKRLDRLENLIMETSAPSSSGTRANEKDRKMDRHFASISRSLNGEVGKACGSHRDCRPGRCCHLPSPTSAAAAASPVCVRHDLSETAGCSDSCQCTLQLQCFRSKDNITQSICKKASSTDIVTGTYLNQPDAIF